MKKLIIAQILIIFSISVLAQVVKYNLPPKSQYQTGSITLKDFKKYECIKVQISEDSVTFININSNQLQTLPLSTVDYFRVKEGSQAGKWAGLGGLVMGLSALSAVIEYPGYYDAGSFIFVSTLSGAAIGGLIGLFIPKWKTYYLDK